MTKKINRVKRLMIAGVVFQVFCIVAMLIFYIVARSTKEPPPKPAFNKVYPELFYIVPSKLGYSDDGEVSFESITWRPDSKALAFAGLGIVVYSLQNGEYVELNDTHTMAPPISLVWNTNGTLLAGAGSEISIWDAQTGIKIFLLEDTLAYRQFRDIDWAAQDNLIVAISSGLNQDDQAIWVWKYGNKTPLTIIHNSATSSSSGFLSMSFNSCEGTLATTSADANVRIWDIETGKELALLQDHNEFATDVSFNPEKPTLASVSFEDKSVVIWDLNTKTVAKRLELNYGVASIAWNKNGTILAIAHEHGLILWHVDMDQTETVADNVRISQVTWSNDNKMLALIDPSGIRILDMSKLSYSDFQEN